MATAGRKARKRAGIKFVHPTKVATPLSARSFVTEPVRRMTGDAMPIGAHKLSAHRSPRRVKGFIESGGIKRGSSLSGRAAERGES